MGKIAKSTPIARGNVPPTFYFPDFCMSFADLGLSDELLRAVTESGYDTPTPIQQQAIPSVLMMRDLIAIAQTGTGKTGRLRSAHDRHSG